MQQEDVLEYVLLPDWDCEVYKTKNKPEGVYYFIRNQKTRAIATVYPIVNRTNKSYTPTAVCHICDVLSIPIHKYGRPSQELLDKVKKDAQQEDGASQVEQE